MATAHRADGWQQSAGRPDRLSAAPRPPRPERMRSDRIPSDRMAERMRVERSGPGPDGRTHASGATWLRPHVT